MLGSEPVSSSVSPIPDFSMIHHDSLPGLQAPPQYHLSPVLAVLLPYADNHWIVYSLRLGSNKRTERHDAYTVLIAVLRDGSLLHPGVDFNLVYRGFGKRQISQMTLVTLRVSVGIRRNEQAVTV